MRAFAVIGPSQSGKSTLVESLAGLEAGHPNSVQMNGDTRLSQFQYMGDDWTAIDVPGGPDNLAQIGPILAACDAAVLCVPAEADAAVLSAPYLRMLEESGMPTILFINRIDVASDRVADIVASLQPYCGHGIVLRQVPMRDGEDIVGAIDLISERCWKYQEGERSALVELPDNMAQREEEARSELLESLADFDDGLLEQIIEDQTPVSEDVYEVATRVLQQHDLVPALLGSAEQGSGVQRLMKSLRHEMPQVDALRERLSLPTDVTAIGCMADHIKHLGKAVMIRALSDGVAAGNKMNGATIGGLHGIDTKTSVNNLAAGEFAVTIKSDHISVGNFLSVDGTHDLPVWAEARPALLHRLAKPVHEKDEGKLSTALTRISEIDHGLDFQQDESTGLVDLALQGTQHMRRVEGKLDEDFGIEVEFSDVPTALRETIKRSIEKSYRHRKQSGGAGQFADVKIDVKKMPLGTGFAFDEIVKGGAVPRNYIPAVEHGARDALAEGPAGFPVVDVAVTLKDGKAHSVDSSDFAFRTAGLSAVREALAEAGTVVLQPILGVDIHVPSVFAGDLVQLVSGLKGQVLGFEGHPTAAGWDVFRATLPVSSLASLSQSLSSATRGTAWFTSELSHYEETREPVPA